MPKKIKLELAIRLVDPNDEPDAGEMANDEEMIKNVLMGCKDDKKAQKIIDALEATRETKSHGYVFVKNIELDEESAKYLYSLLDEMLDEYHRQPEATRKKIFLGRLHVIRKEINRQFNYKL